MGPTQVEALVKAALQVARVECKSRPCGSDSCSGPWCGARGQIRRALEDMGVEWRPKKQEQSVERGPPHTFSQDTLNALASLPQPPEDDQCERRTD